MQRLALSSGTQNQSPAYSATCTYSIETIMTMTVQNELAKKQTKKEYNDHPEGYKIQNCSCQNLKILNKM